MSGFRLAVRLARREMGRRPWRTVLVLLMVLVPTAAMTAAATFVRTSERTPEDRLASELGRADLTAHPATEEALPGTSETIGGRGLGGTVATTVLVMPPTELVPPLKPGLPSPAVSDEAVAALRAALPVGTSILVERRAQDRWRDGDRRTYFSVSDVDLDSAVVEGRFDSLRGRVPARDGEAVVAEDVARRLGLSIGDRLRPERLGRELTVVGTVRALAWPEDVVVTRGPLPAARQEVLVFVDLPGRPFAGMSAEDVAFADVPTVTGWSLSPAVPSATESKDEEVFWTYVAGAVALAVLGTVIAAAFAVSARRQLRTLGLLSASGASPRTLRWLLVAQGATIGVTGSVLGVAAGLAAAAAVPDRWLRSFAGRHVDGLVVRPADLLPVVVIGAAAAAVAAWLPARSISTVPTLQALAGRRPLGAVPARLPASGAVAVAAGCALFAMAVAGTRQGGSNGWALVAITGGLACLFGALAVCPWVVAALERLAGGWPQAWRLAARSIARSRVRSSAVVGAIVAVSASLVAGTTLFASFRDPPGEQVPWIAANQVRIETVSFEQAAGRPEVAPVPHEVVDRARAIVPQVQPVDIEEVGTVGTDGWFEPVPVSFEGQGLPAGLFAGPLQVAVATPELLDLFDVPADRRAALDRGEGVAVTGSGDARRVALYVTPNGVAQPSFDRIPLATPFRSPQAARSLPEVLLAEDTVRRIGLTSRRSPAVTLIAPEPLSEKERRDLRRLAEDVSWERDLDADTAHVQLLPPDDPDPVSPARVRAVAMALAFALVAVVVGIGLTLAAKDSADERQVLTAVGAPPRTLRRVAALRAALLVAAAAVVAVPTGLLPAAAIVEAATAPESQRSLHVDALAVLYVVVGAPILVAAAVSSAAAVRDRLRPPRGDTFAFGE